ncbi:MAG: transposase [Nitrososphaerales archaeon]|nr:transposase [Nitrososphaerales archaeon]
MGATKCVTQIFQNDSIDDLLRDCLTLTYNAVHYGEENGITNRKGMKEFYRSLKGVELPSCYKLAVISRACAVLDSRKKSRKRGFETKHTKPLRPAVCIISGFFITAKGRLFIPLRKRNEYADVLLNRHAQERLAGKELRSLTITQNALSLCYSEEIAQSPVKTVYGVDRNEKNLTFGNSEGVVQIDMAKAVRIRQTTREIVKSFKRSDVRVRRTLASKYWKRAANRTNQMLHAATNFLVDTAVKDGAALALEDLTNIGKMYRKGNGQGNDYRFRLNSWPHWKAYRMLEYKAAWKGVTMIPLTRSETYGSSSTHACGERLRSPERDDMEHRRMLWCQACKTWTDRDVNAAVVLSQRGLARFASSLPQPAGRSQQVYLLAGGKGEAVEAVRGNGTQTPILRVDASKLGGGHGPTLYSVGHGPST